MLNADPVCTALKYVLSGRENVIRLYAYQESFNELWGVDNGIDQLINELITSKIEDIIVIWDEIPQGDTRSVNTTLYLTPIDWAMAFSLAACRIDKDNSNFRITIIDLNSDTYASAPTVRFINQYHKRDVMAMPWIRIVRPIYAKDKKGIDEREHDIKEVIFELFSGCDDNSEFKSLVKALVADSSYDFEVIRSVWRSNLIKTPNTDDHHAIANLLGPQLLLGETVRKADVTVQALRCVMLVAGLFPSESGVGALLTGAVSWLDPAEHPAWRTIKKRAGNRLKLILVDDQWQDGWGEVLCKAVGLDFNESGIQTSVGAKALAKISCANQNISVYATSSANVILEKLEIVVGLRPSQTGRTAINDTVPLQTETTGRDSRFTLKLDDGGDEVESAEILFLDLRLFSGSSVKEEAEFVGRVLAVAHKINEKWGDQLPWPEFSADELGRITAWVTKAKELPGDVARTMPEYAAAITLFPRIIAHIDLSLPIVLFTSTGRRDIMKAFDAYRSIICEFEKPRMSGTLADDLATPAKEQFVSAITRALEMLDARLVCQRLFEFPKLVRPQQNPLSDGQWTIELYVDESGSEIDKKTSHKSPRELLTVGGLLAIFGPGHDPNAFNRELLEHMKGVVSFKLASKEVKQKIRDNADSFAGWIQDATKNNSPTHVSLVTLRGSIDTAADEESGSIELSRVGDNLHRELMTYVTELAVYHLAMRFVPPFADVSCRVYLPTRHLPGKPGEPDYAKDLFNRLGIESFYVGNNRALWEAKRDLRKYPDIVRAIDEAIGQDTEPLMRIRYFGFDAARPLVQSVTRYYKYGIFRPMVDHARAYKLESFAQSGKEGGPRAMHLLTDALFSPKAEDTNIKMLTERGLQGTLGQRLRVITHASRMCANRQYAEALIASVDVFGKLKSFTGSATDVVGRELNDALGQINGTDYFRLIEARKERTGIPAEKVSHQHQLTGYVQQINQGSYLLSDGKNGLCKLYRTGTNGLELEIGEQVVFTAGRGELPDERMVTKVISSKKGPELEGKVNRIENYGAFVSLCNGMRGLLYISKIVKSFEQLTIEDVRKYFTIGDQVVVQVLPGSESCYKLKLRFICNRTRNSEKNPQHVTDDGLCIATLSPSVPTNGSINIPKESSAIDLKNVITGSYLPAAVLSASQISLAQGREWTEEQPFEKELIEVTKIIAKYAYMPPKLICKRSNNDLVTVSANQTKNGRITTEMISVGSVLKGIITKNNEGMLYASQIELANK
jgi:predicted RNA-binding protein with RPS1 domain